MTELDRMQIVENMFPDWREHLSDGKIIDQILDGLTCQKIVFNRCSRPGCNHAARRGRKTCIECAAKAAQYMRSYGRRRSGNSTKVATRESAFGQNLGGGLTAQLAV
jgi:hypothetical protein